MWTETRTGGNQVHVANGYLTVNLGSVTSFGSINWNQQLWLTMNIGGTGGAPSWDGEMNPRLLLTATPYAFQAGQLGVTSGSNIATLSFTAPTATDSIVLPDASGTVCLQNATACGFAPASGGSGYVQLQGSTPGSAQTGNFNISGTGIAGTLQASTVDTASSGALNIGNTNATSISLGNTGSNILTTINGTALVKPTSGHDSATAFQVQNAAGAGLFTVDSSNTALVLGNDGTPSALTVRGGAASGTDAAGANLTFDASNGTGSGGSGDIIFRTASGTGPNVTFDAQSSTNANSSSLSWTDTIGAHPNMLLVVYVGIKWNFGGPHVNSATYDGTNLTKLTAQSCNEGTNNDCNAEMWYLPLGTTTAGSHTVVVNLSGSSQTTVAAVTYYNVNQTTPLGTAVTAYNSNFASTSISLSVSTSSTRQLVIDGVTHTSCIPSSPGSGQTTDWSNGSGEPSAGSEAEGTTLPVTMSWGPMGCGAPSAQIGVAINPATAGGSSSDLLEDKLHIASDGNIGINNSTPQYTLDVNGYGHFSTAVQTPLLQSAASTALTITGNAASTWSTTAGDLTIQGGSGNVSLGTSTVLTASGSLAIQPGTAGSTLTVGVNNMTGNLTFGNSTAGQTINIGHATVANGKTQNINIGDAATGTGKDQITIGNTNGASSLTLQAGTGNFSLTGAAGTTYTIGAAGTTGQTTLGQSTASNTISIGAANTATGNTQTIAIGSGTGAGTGKAVVTLGSLANASATTIQAGTGNIALDVNQAGAGVIVQTLTNNSTSAFKVQDASSDTILTVDSADRQVIVTNANDTAAAGSELFTAAYSFSSAGGWTGIAGTGSSATATHTNGGGAGQLSASPAMTITAGAVYKVTYTVSGMTGGSVTASIGGVSGSAVSSNTTETDYITTTGTGNLIFTPTNSFDGTVSSVSVKQMSNQTAPLVLNDSTGTVAAEFRVGTTANGSLGIGYQSLQANVGTKNTAFGLQALSANTSGISNTGIGALALLDNTTGNLNTAIGLQGLKVNTNGNNNTSLGAFALDANTTGGGNTAIGYEALDDITTGLGVTGLGGLAGTNGSQTDFQTLSTISSATLLGRYAQATCSSCVILGGQGADQASVGIGTPNPTNFFSVEPTQYNTGTVSTTASSGSVTGSGTTFTAALVGSEIFIASNSTTTATYKGTVSSFTDATHITVSPNVSYTISGAHYYILYGGLQVTSSGTVYTQGTSTTQFQVQTAAGTSLLTVDTSGLVVTVAGSGSSFATLTLSNAHFKSTQTTAPTIGTPSNCGTSPSSSMAAGSTDSAGSFTITNGNPTGTTCDTVITFNKAYGAAPKSIVVSPQSSASAAARQIYVSASAAGSFTVKYGNAVSTPSEADSFYYWVVE
ncbi:MAG TPA: hypothetical protein VH599_07275 [Ktedonobacterales bacterium]